MKRILVIGIPLTVLVAALAFALATSVISHASAAGPATVSPTTGQPGSSAGVGCEVTNGATSSPGKANSSPGAPFNEPGINSTPGGQAGTVYAGNDGTASKANSNSTAAVSQYDVACLQVTSHHP